MKLILHKPCTYFTSDSPVKILDEKENIFFYHPNEQKKINFNLPEGTFCTENNLTKKSFQPYEEFNGSALKKDFLNSFEFSIADNKNKATINPNIKKITIDKKYGNHWYKPLKIFVVCHEVRHLEVGGSIKDEKGNIIFDAEKACDDFAKNYMLSHGYNPTQVEAAKEILISGAERRKCISDSMNNKNFRR